MSRDQTNVSHDQTNMSRDQTNVSHDQTNVSREQTNSREVVSIPAAGTLTISGGRNTISCTMCVLVRILARSGTGNHDLPVL